MGRSYSYHRQKRGSKFKNKRTERFGLVFDSGLEADRYGKLKDLEEQGKIHFLERQVKFNLIPNQRGEDGKVIRGVNYIADFVYQDEDGNTIVEDAKGMLTDVYKIKKKLMLFIHHIQIREVKR